MRKFIGILILFLLFLVNASQVSADLMNPDWSKKTCKPGEIEVICNYRSEEPFGPRTADGCKKYKNDSDYYYLVGHGSSFGGEEKHCLKEGLSGKLLFHHVGSFIPELAITLVIEVAIFFIVGFREQRKILSVVLANLISLPIAYFIIRVLSFDSLFIIEALVVVFEAVFIKSRHKEVRLAWLLAASILANLFSFLGGTVLLGIAGIIF
jgi:hypothetical protein